MSDERMTVEQAMKVAMSRPSRNPVGQLMEASQVLADRVDALEKACQILLNGMGGHNHWDSTQRSGAGCLTCQQQREARKQAGMLIEGLGLEDMERDI